MKMNVVEITGPMGAQLKQKPYPKVKGNFAVVRIEIAPMCTEYKAYQAGGLSDTLGHEAAGEVVDVARPGRVKVGDRVVVMPQYPCGRCQLCMTGDYIHCQDNIDPLAVCGSQSGTATYAEYCLKQDWLLLPIPDGMSYEHASMACCGLGPTFGAAQRLQVNAFDTLLVVGLGPVGLGAVINGVYRGAEVFGLDPLAYRRALALELGAAKVFDPVDPEALSQVRAAAGGRGVDKTVDCTAVPAAQQFAVAATRRRGGVAFVGWGGGIETGNMVPGGLALHGVWHWNLQDAHPFMRMIGQVGDLIDKQVTHTFPMRRVEDAWQLQISGECGKVLLRPGE